MRGACLFTGTSTSFRISTATSRDSGSSNSAKPKRQGFSSPSVARIHRRSLPAACRMRSTPSSPPNPSVIPPTNSVRTISSRVGGWSCIIASRGLWRCPSMLEEPRPGRRPGPSGPRSRPISGPAGFAGPEVPSLITGAEKLMFGMFGGGWKLAGKAPGRPGCWVFACCMPGAAVPGAAIPGGGAEAGQHRFPPNKIDYQILTHAWRCAGICAIVGSLAVDPGS